MAAFTNDWSDMIRQAGVNRFLIGLQRAIQSTTFFPVLADIRKHMPDPVNLNEYSGPSPEDLRRKASGERAYGTADAMELWKMFEKRRKELGRPTTERDWMQLMDEIDQRIDNLPRKARGNG